MEEFTVMCKILLALKNSMDYDCSDEHTISAEALRISENKRLALLRMLVTNGYIEGCFIDMDAAGNFYPSMARPMITLKGLEYLDSNSAMKKAYRTLKGIKDIIPGA